MAEKLALVVSGLHPYMGDVCVDFVYTVIEFQDVRDRPHRALVDIPGIREGDLVSVAIQQLGTTTTYRIVEKVAPPTPDKRISRYDSNT